MNAAFVLLAVYVGSPNVGHISGGGGGGNLYSPQPAFIGEAPSDFKTSARLRYISEMKKSCATEAFFLGRRMVVNYPNDTA